MTVRPVIEETRFWHASDIGNVDLLKATFVSHSFPRHAHEGYVIGIIEAGAEAFHYRGALHTAPAGSIVLINPDTVHTGHAADDAGWTYRMMYPAEALLKTLAGQMAGRPVDAPYFPDPVIFDPPLARDIRRLHRTLETGASTIERQHLFMATMARLITRHAGNRPPSPKTGGDHRAVRQIKTYLVEHHADNIGLAHLARLTGLSPYYLTRLFTKATGMPPHAYLTQVRIFRAKQLLRQGFTLSETAVATGFSDQSHLSRHFKRLVGVTPGRYATGCIR